MRIYSMTATFGKLEHQTLTFQPGLNVIHAPNEWGKSTWCAFLIAMLYGIDSKERTTLSHLADKDRYAPWSGSNMSGSMQICWNGRDITVERTSKGRFQMNQFRAYETKSGLDVPELTATNCGEMLLGVEKSVFTRSAFVRLTDLPLTNDESLRRRLNALVTTGDETGASDDLAEKLKNLKNSCRSKKSGLLPQAEAQRSVLEEKLRELERLKDQTQALEQEQERLKESLRLLENHQIALDFNANQLYTQKLAAAQLAAETARQQVNELEALCATLPASADLEAELIKLSHLRSSKEAMQTEALLLPAMPQKPEVPPAFLGLPPETALQMAETDARVYQEAEKEKNAILPTVFGLSLAGASLLCLLIPHWAGILCGALGSLSGVALAVMNGASRRRAANTAHALENKYAPIPCVQWAYTAEKWAEDQTQYARELKNHQEKKAELDSRLAALNAEEQRLTQGQSISACEQRLNEARAKQTELDGARKELERANALAQTLQEAHKETPPPAFPDTLELDPQETARRLQTYTARLPVVHQHLGQIQGQMEALGREDVLSQELSAVNIRIEKLELTFQALELAQTTLAQAAEALQRRFAPKLTKSAREFFGKLTDGRYDRLTLDQELAVSAGAQGEDTLREGMWRSDGTVDQLYLSLRLAVAQELTPEAPLVLDDTLVRFDDKRMALALDLLKTMARDKQVLLFSCQERETAYLAEKIK